MYDMNDDHDTIEWVDGWRFVFRKRARIMSCVMLIRRAGALGSDLAFHY